MLEVILIDKSKNSIVFELPFDVYHEILNGYIDYKKVKRNKTKTELIEELNEFLKKDEK